MSDIMTPIPFGKMMNWILEEHKKGAISASEDLLWQIRARNMRSLDAH